MIDLGPQTKYKGLVNSLVRLNLSCNRVTDFGCQSLANFIEKSKLIHTVQIHWNRIRGQGSMYLSQAIKKNESLRVLDCSFNSFGSDCVKSFLVKDSED